MHGYLRRCAPPPVYARVMYARGLSIGVGLAPLLSFVLLAGAASCGGHPLSSRDAAPDVAANDAKDAALADRSDAGLANDAPVDAPAAPDAPDAPDAASASDAPDGNVSNPDARAAYVGAVAAFCDEKARHLCAWNTRCNRAFASEADCRPVERARCEASLGAWRTAGAGEERLMFDPTNVAACLAQLDNPECEIEDRSACERLTAGRLPDGAPCVYDAECAGGTCGHTASCAGTCRSPGKVGAPCYVEGARDCDPKLAWCDYTTHTCQPQKPLGASCSPASGGGQCGPGNTCETTTRNRCGDVAEDDVTTCRCRALGVAGASCSFDVNCLDGLFCVAGICRGLGARGATCDLEILVGCADDLACLPKAAPGSEGLGVCGDRLPAGSKCFGRECARGTTCEYPEGGDENSGRCTPLHPVGTPCVYVTDCVPGAYCRPGDFTCAPSPRLEESCEESSNCWGGGNVECLATPTGYFCGVRPRLGEACYRACSAGSYCAGGTCVPQKEHDEICDGSGECRSGQCVSQTPAGCTMASCRIKRCVPACWFADLPPAP